MDKKMNLEELAKLMIEHGLVIRAIPHETTSNCEARHKDSYPDGVVYYDEYLKRDMLRVTRQNSQGGKFIIAKKGNQDSTVNGWEWNQLTRKKVAFYDTIEEAIESFIK
ncbi:hypothetical protein EEL31_08745 [Brevibacillus laterosporus]|nr:hypothetical protein EEL31_08745 [Brevibacillus laterosporus]